VTEPTSDKYKVRFESTGDKDDVPKGGNKLTGEQMKLQVSMYFEQVSTFHLKFGVEGEEKDQVITSCSLEPRKFHMCA